MKYKYNWKEIQQAYNSGLTWKEIENKFGCKHQTISAAVKRGDFVSRSKSDANKLAVKRGRTKHKECWTKELRQKISKQKKELYQNFPEKHPNRRCAGIKMSYPEKLVYDYLLSINLDFMHNPKIGKCYPDFVIGRLIIEVDGARWHKDKEKEEKRDEYLRSFDYEIVHIPAKNVIKHLKKLF